MKHVLSALALAAALFGGSAVCAQDYKLGPLTIDQPWARASAGAATTGAAYMAISTSGTAPDQLVGASTPVAEKAELHTHVMEGDVMRMRPVQAIDINVGEPAVLKPGGLHVMLLGLKAPLKEGEEFPLTLNFKQAGSVTVEVRVGTVGTLTFPEKGGHQH
jgi:copper(I)-binding protein